MSGETLLVVIPCLNEADHITEVIRQLLADDGASPGTTGSASATGGVPAQRGRAARLQVVVVDGGSTDGTRGLVRSLASSDDRIHLLDNPDRIQSSAVNRAIEAFGDGGEYFVRIDAHAGYPPGFCTSLLAEARATGADSVVVRMRTAGNGVFQVGAAAAQNSPLGNGGSAHRRATDDETAGAWVDHGHHALLRVEAFRAVDGYDETFTHNEDAELDVRLRAAGFRIWMTARTWCVYYPRETPGALLRQYVNYGRGRAANLLKHRTVPKVRQTLPLLVAPSLGLLPLARRHRLAAVPALSWAAACLGYGAVLGARQRQPAVALAGPAAMIMHLGWSIGFWRTVVGEAAQAAQPARPRRSTQSARTGGQVASNSPTVREP